MLVDRLKSILLKTNTKNYMEKAPTQEILELLKQFKKDKKEFKFTNMELSNYIKNIINPLGYYRTIGKKGLVYNLFLSVYRNTPLHTKYI